MSPESENAKLAETRAPINQPPTVLNVSPPAPATCKQLPMVGWYDPRQLTRTSIQVAISTIFGRHSDRRLVEALAAGRRPEIYDYTYHYKDDGRALCEIDKTHRREEIWIDYVADLGEGWNSTYAIACALAAESHEFEYTDTVNGELK